MKQDKESTIGENKVFQGLSDAELTSETAETPQYPAQDGGLKAWLFLFGACIVEITAWGWFGALPPDTKAFSDCDIGFPYCYGVFREYFFKNDPFKGDTLVSTGGMLANVCTSSPPLLSISGISPNC